VGPCAGWRSLSNWSGSAPPSALRPLESLDPVALSSDQLRRVSPLMLPGRRPCLDYPPPAPSRIALGMGPSCQWPTVLCGGNPCHRLHPVGGPEGSTSGLRMCAPAETAERARPRPRWRGCHRRFYGLERWGDVLASLLLRTDLMVRLFSQSQPLLLGIAAPGSGLLGTGRRCEG